MGSEHLAASGTDADTGVFDVPHCLQMAAVWTCWQLLQDQTVSVCLSFPLKALLPSECAPSSASSGQSFSLPTSARRIL